METHLRRIRRGEESWWSKDGEAVSGRKAGKRSGMSGWVAQERPWRIGRLGEPQPGARHF